MAPRVELVPHSPLHRCHIHLLPHTKVNLVEDEMEDWQCFVHQLTPICNDHSISAFCWCYGERIVNSNAFDSQKIKQLILCGSCKARRCFLPTVQDHHRHMGVFLQPGENCLSRGFHFCLAASLYLAQDSP